MQINKYKKNDILELDIVDMTNEGLGISKLYGQVFFVKDALIGDKVEALITKITSNIIYAKTTSIIKESKDRVKAECSVANACGGCKILSLNYQKQLELKKKYTLTCMSKIGRFGMSPYQGVIGANKIYNFRNKMQIPFAMRDGVIVYGFYAGRTHHIIEFENCVTGFNGSKLILDTIKGALKIFNLSIYDEKTQSGVFREVMLRKGNETGEVSITYILNDNNYKKHFDLYKKFDEYIVSTCNSAYHSDESRRRGEHCEPVVTIVTSTININTKNNNTIFGNENIILHGKGYIEDSIGDVKYYISPESFYQVNSEMTKKLYDKIVEYGDFKGDENVLDLYCGIGTISLYVAKKVKSIVGVEVVKKAIENAKENAVLNSIDNAYFLEANLETDGDILDDVVTEKFKKGVDVVIVDPPRKGLDELTINYIKKIRPEKLIYVSCNPATLARDLNIFCHAEMRSDEIVNNDSKYEPSYRLVNMVNVDMFPHTMHVETVVLMSRKDT